MKGSNRLQLWWKILRQAAVAVAFAAVVAVLMLWLAGRFAPKIGAAPAAAEELPRIDPARTVEVRKIQVPRSEQAVGTVRAVNDVVVTSKVPARVVALDLKAGQQVQAGDVLLKLDDTDLRARLQAARAAVTRAASVLAKAESELKRYEALPPGAASRQEMEDKQLAVKTGRSELTAAEEGVKEIEALLAYTTIVSPITGVIVDRKVSLGDIVTPGQVLVTLYDPTHMQLVASVREGLTYRLKVGQELSVRMEALAGRVCTGKVAEIVPESESASRSFLVKVTGPCPPGIYSGMFGRIEIPLGQEELIVIPRAAVRRVGQLTMVDVVDSQGRPQRRAVQLGRELGEDVVVLSGLDVGERILPRAGDL